MMQRKYFEPGQVTVLTADLCTSVHKGECGKCPGVASVKDLRPTTHEEPVFCTHECHLKRNKEAA